MRRKQYKQRRSCNEPVILNSVQCKKVAKKDTDNNAGKSYIMDVLLPSLVQLWSYNNNNNNTSIVTCNILLVCYIVAMIPNHHITCDSAVAGYVVNVISD